MPTIAPRWDLTNVFDGLKSPKFVDAMAQFERRVGELEQVFDERAAQVGPDTDSVTVVSLLDQVLDVVQHAARGEAARSAPISIRSSAPTRTTRWPGRSNPSSSR